MNMRIVHICEINRFETLLLPKTCLFLTAAATVLLSIKVLQFALLCASLLQFSITTQAMIYSLCIMASGSVRIGDRKDVSYAIFFAYNVTQNAFILFIYLKALQCRALMVHWYPVPVA